MHGKGISSNNVSKFTLTASDEKPIFSAASAIPPREKHRLG